MMPILDYFKRITEKKNDDAKKKSQPESTNPANNNDKDLLSQRVLEIYKKPKNRS